MAASCLFKIIQSHLSPLCPPSLSVGPPAPSLAPPLPEGTSQKVLRSKNETKKNWRIGGLRILKHRKISKKSDSQGQFTPSSCDKSFPGFFSKHLIFDKYKRTKSFGKAQFSSLLAYTYPVKDLPANSWPRASEMPATHVTPRLIPLLPGCLSR